MNMQREMQEQMEERAKLKAQGKPIPDHLKPKISERDKNALLHAQDIEDEDDTLD